MANSATVELAFTWYATGQYSNGDIARMLNEHRHTDEGGQAQAVHFRTKVRRGRSDPARFSKDIIRDLLQNLHYTCQTPCHGPTTSRKRDPVVLYPGQHPALVDQETFDRCQEVRALMSCHPRRAVDHMSYSTYCRACSAASDVAA